MNHVTHDPIQLDRLIAEVSDPGRGAIVVFLGTVRRGPDDGPVREIEYSAYEAMAAGEFQRIVNEAAGQSHNIEVAAQHRLGTVPTGDPSIAVVAAAPHRAEAFTACRYVIEQAKLRLPVWKKERLDDGGTRWRENPDGSSTPGVAPPADGDP